MVAARWTVLLSVVGHGVTANPLVKGDWGATFYFQVRKKPMSPGIPPGYSITSAFKPKPSGLS